MDSWGVAALADEPGVLVAAFVTHHLEQGAAEVHVCLDRPNEEARDLLAGVPGAVLHAAGEDGWAFNGLGRRPGSHLGRQKYHASRVLAQTRLDWIVHCDTDEFVWPVAGRPVGAVLAGVRAGASWLRIEVAERVHRQGAPVPDIFAGPFRLPRDDFATWGRPIYDEAARMLLHRGVSGHQLGKSAVRSGRGLFAGVHRPVRDWRGADRDIPFDGTADLRLLHFDGLTELHYALKMVRRALALQGAQPPSHGPHRLLQIEALAGAGGDARAIHDQWQAAKTITPAQAAQLADLGLLRDFTPGIAARLGRDCSPAAFDQALLAREEALIARAAQAFGFDPTPFRA